VIDIQPLKYSMLLKNRLWS